jgi:uncharacterized membrane protein
MNKTRIESLSDCVFSIVMTLLIIDIRVPAMTDANSIHELWGRLVLLWPLFRSYYFSFAILGMYWITHHALFHVFVKHANRPLTYINIVFLCFISLIPFSAHLVGQYPQNELAVSVYGGNVILIGMVQYLMFHWAVNDDANRHEAIDPKIVQQATIRLLLPPCFSLLGIIVSPFSSALSFVLFAFPIVFNIIPGTISAVERVTAKIIPKG